MATDYLEKYIESVSDLPAQLQRKFRLIRDLDEKSAKLQADVNDKCRKQLTAAASGAKSPGGSNKRPRLSPGAAASDPLVAEITQGQAQLLSWAEEKMHIAFQVYDLVDKHIRELDEDLKSFASEIDNEAQSLGLGEEETACDRLGLEGGARVRGTAALGAAAAAAAGQAGRQKRKTAGRRKGAEAALADAAAAAVAAATAAAAAGGGLHVDVAADASQPRYCLCQNVSYGEMVACDNPECPIEWFHYACVGLTEQPKGKWYCPECAAQFQQKQHGHGHGHAGQQHHQPPHKKTGKR